MFKNIIYAVFMCMGMSTIGAMQKKIIKTEAFTEIYEALLSNEQDAINRAIEFMVEYGLNKKSHTLRDGLSEYVWNNGNRLYYTVCGDDIILLNFAYKKNDTKQQKHVATARRAMKNYIDSLMASGGA